MGFGFIFLNKVVDKPPEIESKPVISNATKPRSLWPMAFAVVGLALIIAGTVIVMKIIRVGEKVGEGAVNAPGKLAATIADAFKPKVTYNTVIHSTLQNLQHDPKLVVMTASVNVEITKESEKTLWGMVYMGKSKVRIKAYGNKVQYIVPMQGLSETNFFYDDFHKRVIVTVPPPQLDNNMVSVQSDPAMMEIETDVGWGRADKMSGDFLRDAARRDLRPAVVREGKSELLMEKARADARKAIQKMLQPMAESLNEHVEIWVLFSDENGLSWSQPLKLP
jgi:hypothetical protein